MKSFHHGSCTAAPAIYATLVSQTPSKSLVNKNNPQIIDPSTSQEIQTIYIWTILFMHMLFTIKFHTQKKENRVYAPIIHETPSQKCPTLTETTMQNTKLPSLTKINKRQWTFTIMQSLHDQYISHKASWNTPLKSHLRLNNTTLPIILSVHPNPIETGVGHTSPIICRPDNESMTLDA